MENDETPFSFDEWYEKFLRPTRELPKILYYYCAVDSFVKIVTSRTLWFTNLFFMNDSQEFFWLRRKARSIVSQLLQENPDEVGYQWLDTMLQQEGVHDIYCACFSELPDSLNQWRSYADNGAGFAIGFSTEHLHRLCGQLSGTLCDVIYDDASQDRLLQRVFDLPPRTCDGEFPTPEEGASDIVGRLFEAASRSKSKSFIEEREWRLVCSSPCAFSPEDETAWTRATSPKYMARKGVVTPYMEVPLVGWDGYRKQGIDPILEVYLGPKNTAKEQVSAVASMLDDCGFRRLRLLRSEVSYR